jgi:hypothetical protein
MLNFNVEESQKEIDELSEEEKERFNNIKLCFYSTQNGGVLEVDKKALKYSDERFLKDLRQRFKVRGLGMKKKLYRLISDIL